MIRFIALKDTDAAKPDVESGLEATFNAAETAAMGRAVVNLFGRWGLTDQQARTLLGAISQSSWSRWKKDGPPKKIGPDQAARLSNLMGIHKALRILFGDSDRAYAWIKAPNRHLGDKSALEVMLNGQISDLTRIRRYLDAQRGGW